LPILPDETDDKTFGFIKTIKKKAGSCKLPALYKNPSF